MQFPIPVWSPKHKREPLGRKYQGVPNLDRLSRLELKAFACRYSYNNDGDKRLLVGNPDNLEHLWKLVWYARYVIGYEITYTEKIYSILPVSMQFRDFDKNP